VRRKPQNELPEAVRVVLACSTNILPCEKFRRADIYKFADHLKNDNCDECIAWFRQADKELRTIELLSAAKPRRVTKRKSRFGA